MRETEQELGGCTPHNGCRALNYSVTHLLQKQSGCKANINIYILIHVTAFFEYNLSTQPWIQAMKLKRKRTNRDREVVANC